MFSDIHKKIWLGTLITTFGMLRSSSASTKEDSQSEKLNVLLISVDDLNYHLGIAGKPVKSPNIDALARDGVYFKNTYANVPICGASRASFLSGIRPTRENRMRGARCRLDKIYPDAISMPMHFKNNGYYTYGIRKVFDAYEDMAAQSWSEGKVWNQIYDPSLPRGGSGYKSKEARKIFINNVLTNEHGRVYHKGPLYDDSADVTDDVYPGGKVANHTVEMIGELKDKEESWFLATGFIKPHMPFNCPKKYWDMYNTKDIKLAENNFWTEGGFSHNSHELRTYYGIPKKGPFSEELQKKIIHGYYACVSFVDAQVGKIITKLKETGQYDNTIIVLFGDHGFHLGENGTYGKHTPLQASYRTPLIIRDPRMKKGIVTDKFVELVDVFPTITELVGLEPLKEQFEGISLKPLMENPNRDWKKFVVCRYHHFDTVINDNYTYTIFQKFGEDTISREVLYDLVKDPGENMNVAEKPEYEKDLKLMRKLMREGWQTALPKIN
jgi:arylsulfatase A-like enzyme